MRPFPDRAGEPGILWRSRRGLSTQAPEECLQLHGAVLITHAKEEHLEEKSRMRASSQAPRRLQLRGLSQHPHEVPCREALGPDEVRIELVLTQVLCPIPLCEAEPQQCPERFDEPTVELRHVVPLVQKPLDEGENSSVAPIPEDVEELQVSLFLYQPKHPPHRFLGDLPTGERKDLVQKGHGVPHPTIGPPGNRAKRLLRCVGALRRQDLLKAPGDVGHADSSEVEALASREDGRR